MFLNDLNWNALVSRACDVGECVVMRWEAYRIALGRMDWFYRVGTDEPSYWLDSKHKSIMLTEARTALSHMDEARAIDMWQEAAFNDISV